MMVRISVFQNCHQGFLWYVTEIIKLIRKYKGPRIAKRILKKNTGKTCSIIYQDLLENLVADLNVIITGMDN